MYDLVIDNNILSEILFIYHWYLIIYEIIYIFYMMKQNVLWMPEISLIYVQDNTWRFNGGFNSTLVYAYYYQLQWVIDCQTSTAFFLYTGGTYVIICKHFLRSNILIDFEVFQINGHYEHQINIIIRIVQNY